MLGWAVLGETSGRAHSDTSRQTVRGRGQRQGLEASRGQQPRRGGEGAPASPWDVSTASPVAPTLSCWIPRRGNRGYFRAPPH